MSDPVKPKRGVGMAEGIGVAALIISGLGLWNNWRAEQTGPTEIVEKKVAVPLVLRGTVEDEGKRLAIAAVDPGHALESLRLDIAGGKSVETGGDGIVAANDIEDALPDGVDRDKPGQLLATVTARYVEAGEDRQARKRYAIRYRWDGGGLFGGNSLRITGFRRA